MSEEGKVVHEEKTNVDAEKVAKKSDGFVTMLVKLEKLLYAFFVKSAPVSLPEEATDFLASAGKYLAFVGAVLLFIGIFAFDIASLFYLAAFFAVWKAIKPLGDQDIAGWRLLFYAILLICIAWFISGELIKTIVLWFLGLYILFQIRKEYK